MRKQSEYGVGVGGEEEENDVGKSERRRKSPCVGVRGEE